MSEESETPPASPNSLREQLLAPILEMVSGGKLSVEEVKEQIQADIVMSMGIFVITQIVTACLCPYWRPVAYDIAWAVLGFLVAVIGVLSVRKESSFGVAAFTILLVMLGCLNIAHTLTMRSEHVMVCNMNQLDFKHCNTAESPSLSHCLGDNSCLRDEVKKTPCLAPGKEHCENMDSMDYAFVFNMLVSFFTFSEPAYWGMIYHARLENKDLTEKIHLPQRQDEEQPLLSSVEEKTEQAA